MLLILAVGIYLYAADGPVVIEESRHIQKETGVNQLPAPVSGKNLKPGPAPLSRIKRAAPGASADDTAPRDNEPYVSYPEGIVGLLGVDMETMREKRGAFKNTIVHVEWMDRVNNVLEGLDPQKKAAIIKNHTTLLYLKDLLNEAYLTGEMDYETFTRALADLMKWHQHTFDAMLSDADYETLFELKPEMAEEMIDDIIEASPRYSFVLNPDISTEEVTKQVQGYKLEEVDSHFKKMIYERDRIGKKINEGKITLEEARKALHESQQAFIDKCKQMLTEEEIKTIFGSVEALETGQTQTEPPAVRGDSDVKELGFKIENPRTSIENVRQSLDKEKIEDIRFFYQQRDKEREALIERLNAGEIKERDMENISRNIDAAYEENCRSTLTDKAYQMIFEKKPPAESDAAAAADDMSRSEDITAAEMEGESEASAEQILEQAEQAQ